jgi:copper homeostasis protein
VSTATHLQIMTLIRPREGNFVYTDGEVQVMEQDIHALRPMCSGFVFGALTPQGDIDMHAMERLMKAAQGVPVTFHRAFDRCRDPFTALEQIIDLGCVRILTSGQQPKAIQGVDLLQRLNEQAAGRIIIMPGGGVTPDNARAILDHTGCHEIHASCSSGTGITDPSAVHQLIEQIQ